MANYIYSTASNPVDFIIWEGEDTPKPRQVGKISIAGGANVANKHFITPSGVVTEVTDNELEFLEKHQVFQQMLAGKHLSVQRRKVDVDKVVKDMNARDRHAPLLPGNMQHDADNESWRIAQ